ncbi:cyclic nucleotide-binding domain-containing protein, partial [Gemmatimonadota bacterium]
MERAQAGFSQDAVTETLRKLPLFAGVPDELLQQIAENVSSATEQRVSESLRKVTLFEGISDEDFGRLQDISEAVSLNAGEVLFEEGDEGDEFYVVMRGAVELYKGRDEVREKLAVARDGGAFGEMALLNDAPRSASALAVQDSHLLAIPRDGFVGLLGGDSFAVRILKGLSKALWATSVRFAAKQKQAPESGPSAEDAARVLSRVVHWGLAPTQLPESRDFDITAMNRVGQEGEGRVAWDWFTLSDGRLVLAAFAVDGEGPLPAYRIGIARSVIREVARDHQSLGILLQRANNALMANRVEGVNQWVECALVALGEGEAEWATAGEVNGSVVRAQRKVLDLPVDGFPLGLRADFDYKTYSVPLQPGDYVLAFTGAPSGIQARASEVVSAAMDRSSSEVQELLGEALEDASEGPFESA